MPRDKKFRDPDLHTPPPEPKKERIQLFSRHFPTVTGEKKVPTLVYAYKFLEAGTITNMRLDVSEVTGNGDLEFTVREAGTRKEVTQKNKIKTGSMHAGNFDIGPRDELRVHLVGDVTIVEGFLTFEYHF